MGGGVGKLDNVLEKLKKALSLSTYNDVVFLIDALRSRGVDDDLLAELAEVIVMAWDDGYSHGLKACERCIKRLRELEEIIHELEDMKI